MASQVRQAGGPDWKPAARIKNGHAGTAKLQREGKCRACAGRYLLSRHHLVPKSQRGDDIDANLMPLCADCHGAIHRDDDRTIRNRIRWAMLPDERLYIIQKMGEGWLDARYPIS